MLTEIQTLPKMALPPTSLEILSISQLTDNSKRLQTRTPQPTVLSSYSESDYHWLVGVLDKLIEFIHRGEDRRVPELIENDYEWAHALLIELVDAVGESDTHPLRPLMEFICQLIDNYEDAYVPELTELFPELAEEVPIEAASKGRKSISNIPKQSENVLAAHAFFSMGYLLYQGNRKEKARSAYNMTITLKPDSWEAFYNRGIVRYDLRQYAEAMTDFNQVIELNYNFASAYHNRGIVYSRLDRHKSAIADFDKAIELGLNSFEAYCHRAFAKTALDKYDAAVSDYDKAIELNQDLVEVYEVYNILGILRSELGQYNEALADYAEAIRIKPDYAEAYAYRGVLKAHLGRINKARSDFQKALELAKRPGNSSRLRVFVEDQLQQLDQVASKQRNKKSRRGGQWKGKVKIAEDFDELPESFMEVFRGEDE
jgi:tetratricopeptide (TPR) repeat protein